MKYELGIMSSKWSIEADNPDVAVMTIMLLTQTSAPIVIYSPEGTQSEYSGAGINNETRKVTDFLDNKENQLAIQKAYKTLIKLT